MADEALGVSSVGGVEHDLALLANGGGEAEVDHGGRHHADAGVAMFVVVPRKEMLTKGAAIFESVEAFGKIGAIFHGAELAFRVRIVVGSIRTAVGFGDAEISQ